MNNRKRLSLNGYGLKYKLKISFYLVWLLPFLVIIYLLSNFILPMIGLKIHIAVPVIIVAFIAIIGFFIIKQIIDPIIKISGDVKEIVKGDVYRYIEVKRDDEIGELGSALNQLTRRIRENMDELKGYGAKTSQINLDIQKRIVVLSSLLQISSLISQNKNLDEILNIAIEKIEQFANAEVAFLSILQEEKNKIELKSTSGRGIEKIFGENLGLSKESLPRLFKNKVCIVSDMKNESPTKEANLIRDEFKVKNILVCPIASRGKIIGLVGIGNNQKDFSYNTHEVELLDVFSKHITIAVENDILLHRVEKLEIKDGLTGLYNENFIRARLDEEIKRAVVSQRPCGFVLLNIDSFGDYRSKLGDIHAENALKRVASVLNESISEIDRAARFGDNEFAVVLPEKNKRQSKVTAENIRKRIEFVFSESADLNERLTISAGISENPIDGVTSQELISKAKHSLEEAKDSGKNRVIG